MARVAPFVIVVIAIVLGAILFYSYMGRQPPAPASPDARIDAR